MTDDLTTLSERVAKLEAQAEAWVDGKMREDRDHLLTTIARLERLRALCDAQTTTIEALTATLTSERARREAAEALVAKWRADSLPIDPEVGRSITQNVRIICAAQLESALSSPPASEPKAEQAADEIRAEVWEKAAHLAVGQYNAMLAAEFRKRAAELRKAAT